MSYELVDGAYYVPKNATPFCGQFCDEINWQGETPRRLYGSAVVLLQVASYFIHSKLIDFLVANTIFLQILYKKN